MNKRRIWLVLPMVLLPYLSLLALATIFFSSSNPFFASLMQNVFADNGLYLLAALLGFAFLAVALSIICFVLSIKQEWDALSLAKSAVAVKLAQIPAYIAIFVVGLLMLITLWTIPFALVLYLLDGLVLILSGLLTLSSVINAVRREQTTYQQSWWVIVLQCIFCLDVVAAILHFRKLRKK